MNTTTTEQERIAALESMLKECIAWMDATHRATDLSRAIVADAAELLTGNLEIRAELS